MHVFLKFFSLFLLLYLLLAITIAGISFVFEATLTDFLMGGIYVTRIFFLAHSTCVSQKEEKAKNRI